MRNLFRLAAGIALLTASIARADPPMSLIVEHVNKQGNDRNLSQIYLVGVVDGFGWVNAELSINGQNKLYCQPTKLALEPDQIVSIFMNFSKKWHGDSKAPAGMIMLLALQETFPC